MSALPRIRIVAESGSRHIAVDARGDMLWMEDASMHAGDKRLRRMDVVERLVRDGLAGKSEQKAAQNFEKDYDASLLRPRYASAADIGRPRGRALSDGDDNSVRASAAAGRYRAACRHVGPFAADTLTAMLCGGLTITDYAKPQQPMRKAALLVGLQALVGFYGIDH